MSLTECVGLVNLVDCLDHIHGKMPKLLEQYEWYSLQKKNKIKFLVHTKMFNTYCFQSADIKESAGRFSDNYY